jgi:hypothetical protein
MNKLTTIISISSWLVVLCFSSATSQIGIKGGMGVSDIVLDKDGHSSYLGYEVSSLDLTKPVPSCQIGIFGTIGILKSLEFQPELLFITQGLNLRSDWLHDQAAYNIRIKYLHMPLLISKTFLLKKKWHPRIFTGPYSSIKLDAIKCVEFNGEKNEEDLSQVKSYDFGLILGFAFDFDLSAGQIILDLRASYGLMNMMDKMEGIIPPYDSPEGEMARNVNVVFTVGYRFQDLFKAKKQDDGNL